MMDELSTSQPSHGSPKGRGQETLTQGVVMRTRWVRARNFFYVARLNAGALVGSGLAANVWAEVRCCPQVTSRHLSPNFTFGEY